MWENEIGLKKLPKRAENDIFLAAEAQEGTELGFLELRLHDFPFCHSPFSGANDKKWFHFTLPGVARSASNPGLNDGTPLEF